MSFRFRDRTEKEGSGPSPVTVLSLKSNKASYLTGSLCIAFVIKILFEIDVEMCSSC